MRKMIFCCLLLCASFCGTVRAESLRVAVALAQASVEISCDSAFLVIDGDSKKILAKGKYFVHAVDGKIFFDEKNIFFDSACVAALNEKSLPKINKRSYPGVIKFFLENERLSIINYVAAEKYLACVLPAKTMVVWPDEVIRAQAIAARSYAYHMRALNRKKLYDITAMDAELRYEGTDPRIEKDDITKNISATAGKILVDNKRAPIKALTTSSSGGRTESAKNIFGENFSYLQSVEDFDSDSPDYTWELRVAPVLLENFLAQRGYQIGKISGLRLSPWNERGEDRTPTGRVKSITVSGTLGSAKISGSELAEILSLPSTLFDISTGTPIPEFLKITLENRFGMPIGSKSIDINLKDKQALKNSLSGYHLLSGGKEEKIIFNGRGRGSGVGLSAWGARGMANADEKNNHQKILAHYYPTARLAEIIN